MSMKALEFSKGADAALALVITVDSADAFVQEMRNAKTALLDWKAKHQSACERVMFTITCGVEHHSSIEAYLKQIYNEEDQLAPLLQSMNVDVSLLNASAKPAKTYSFARNSAAKPGASKPWWKFW